MADDRVTHQKNGTYFKDCVVEAFLNVSLASKECRHPFSPFYWLKYLYGKWRNKREEPFSLRWERHWSPLCRTRNLKVWASLRAWQSCKIDTNSWRFHGTSNGTEVLPFSFSRPLFNHFQSMTHVEHLIHSVVLESGYVACNDLRVQLLSLSLMILIQPFHHHGK